MFEKVLNYVNLSLSQLLDLQQFKRTKSSSRIFTRNSPSVQRPVSSHGAMRLRLRCDCLISETVSSFALFFPAFGRRRGVPKKAVSGDLREFISLKWTSRQIKQSHERRVSAFKILPSNFLLLHSVHFISFLWSRVEAAWKVRTTNNNFRASEILSFFFGCFSGSLTCAAARSAGSALCLANPASPSWPSSRDVMGRQGQPNKLLQFMMMKFTSFRNFSQLSEGGNGEWREAPDGGE